MEKFNIRLAGNHSVTVIPSFKEDSKSYELYIQGNYHGSLYPVTDRGLGIDWKSNDNISPIVVNMIGCLIEEHYL